mgnify:FL=1
MIDSDYKKCIVPKAPMYRKTNDKDFIIVKIIDSQDNIIRTFFFSAIFIDEGLVKGNYEYYRNMRLNDCQDPFFYISTKAKIRGLKREELHTINDISPWDNIVLIDGKNISKNNRRSKDAYLPTSIIKQKNKPIIRCNAWYTLGPVRLIYRENNPTGFKLIVESASEIFNADQVLTEKTP